MGLAAALSRSLPAQDVRRLSSALTRGPAGLRSLRAEAGGPILRDACTALLDSGLKPEDGQLVAGALLGAVQVVEQQHDGIVDVVWTGPASEVGTSRLTSSVVVDLIAHAETDVLLVGYAVHPEPAVSAELERAAGRGVEITLLVERRTDNAAFSGPGVAFPGLPALRLAWPAHQRPAGASLHAKILVVDGRSALIGSANITGAALERNLECGLLLRGGPHPEAVRRHVLSLRRLGVLERIT